MAFKFELEFEDNDKVIVKVNGVEVESTEEKDPNMVLNTPLACQITLIGFQTIQV